MVMQTRSSSLFRRFTFK